MPASTWKGFISFGLVSIPIYITPAARTERISFNQLHKVCHTRLKQPLFCPQCERQVGRDEIEKGFEYAKDQYAMFTLEELESIEPESARVMDILEFVKLDEIDPFYFDASYYVAPEPAGIRAYHLLLNAMRKTGYAAIAKATMHNREYIVIVRARKTGLALHTMFYPNEVRSASDLKIGENTEVKPQEEALAEQLIKNLAVSFKPEKFSDSYQEGLKKLIEAKTHGKTLAMPSHKNIGPVIDLMSALKKSLGEKEKPKTLMKAVPQRGESRKKQRKTG